MPFSPLVLANLTRISAPLCHYFSRFPSYSPLPSSSYSPCPSRHWVRKSTWATAFLRTRTLEYWRTPLQREYFPIRPKWPRRTSLLCVIYTHRRYTTITNTAVTYVHIRIKTRALKTSEYVFEIIQ